MTQEHIRERNKKQEALKDLFRKKIIEAAQYGRGMFNRQFNNTELEELQDIADEIISGIITIKTQKI